MTRSLIIAPQWIGDAVMSEPLMARLAARGETLTVAALPWVSPVYAAMPQVTRVIDLPFAHGRLDWAKRREVARGVRGQFDAAYVLPNSLKSALIPFLARIPRRVGYQGEGRVLLLNERLPNPGGRPPMVAFYSALAQGEGRGARSSSLAAAQGHGAGADIPRLHFDPQTQSDAASKVGLTPGQFFTFAPGAEYGPAKCWPADHYAELARSLHAKHGLPIALLGSGKEAELCDRISLMAPDACRVLAGKTSLKDAMALIAASKGLVSNDSGLMHVAAAFGLPQVAVFGSTSPEHTPPLNRRAQVIWLKDELGLECSPCFERTCRFGHTRCLVEVSPVRVEAALDGLLNAGVPAD
ncbi:lipopolysaccharide heptosyltransferase II [Piscinibacter terrae]|uniref:lipopolysaccharide heptosyltransferase II n=1 Tax=Piscinibacter terrae TaxID=2496871 RepID=A0A3N7JSX8_9BURK|nr:lipopolysaccharide heptosyltransferase II [Albitalea terrae]RQP24049.1 lipopolysaccharide heptosyltransferase II [Albitalea terrae]